jgi:glycosyltransferase involved in cell wall biosynthesis
MRILFYTNSSTLYGASSSLINLMHGLTAQYSDLQVSIVIAKRGKIADELDRLSIPYKVIPYAKWIYSFHLFHQLNKANKVRSRIWLLFNIIKRLSTNIIYLPAHIRYTKRFKPDFIYVNSSNSPMGAVVALCESIPIIWHHRETLNDPVTGFYLDFGKKISTILFRKSKLHIFPSKYLEDSYSWLKKGNRLVVFNGVYSEADIFKKHKDYSGINFGMIGRINEQKGQAEVMNLFNRKYDHSHGKVKLVIFGIGNPEYVSRIRNAYPSTGIIFKGFVGKEEIYPKLDFVIVNAQNESFGRIVSEANAHEVPVIARTSGALPEIVKEGVNGFLFSTIDELELIIERVVSESFNYVVLQKTSRQFFNEKFTIENYADTIYQRLKKYLEQ